MKEHKIKFIRNGSILISIFILIVLVLNIFYINTVEKNKLIFRRELGWQNYKKTIPNKTLNYAFFGDSHTEYELNPKYINNSFNFATGGEDYIETYYKIKKLLEQDDVKINNFILEIDIHTFSDKIRTKERLFVDLGYYSKFVDLKTISDLTDRNLLSIRIQSNIRVIGKGGEIISYFIVPPDLTIIENGWVNYTGDFPKEKRKQLVEKIYNTQFSEEKNLLEETSLNHFLKILNLAKENNINIIFINLPISYDYYLEIQKNNISRELYYERLFLEINKTKIPYSTLEYYELFFENPEYFGDPDHLNYVGSKILSQKLSKDLIGMEEQIK